MPMLSRVSLAVAATSLLICGRIAAEDCSNPGLKQAMEHLADITRDSEIAGARDALMEWPVVESLPEDIRKRFRERFGLLAKAILDSPERRQKVVAFYCGKAASGELRPSEDSLTEVLKERNKEAAEDRAIWSLQTLSKVQLEFPELRTPEKELAFGDLFARNRQWVFARENFARVLEAQPKNAAAIEWSGAIPFYDEGILDSQAMNQSFQAFRKLTEIEPNAPEGRYWIGMIRWSLAFYDLQVLRRDYNKTAAKRLEDEDPLPVPLRNQFKAKNETLIDDGIHQLETALKLAPNFQEAQWYVGGLYRLKALEMANPDDAKRYVQMADESLAKVMKLKPRGARELRPELPPPPAPPPPPQS